MTASPSLDPKLRNRITRYLHTGNEVPKYYPGCWTSHYFEADKLKAIDEALENGQNNLEVVDIILKVILYFVKYFYLIIIVCYFFLLFS